MALLKWTMDYSVGVHEFDVEHQKLINIFNELHKAMKERRSESVINKTLNDLLDYTTVHFNTEKKFFAMFNYPKMTEHIKEHNDFLKQIKDFTVKYEKGGAAITIDLMHYIADWIKNHIKGTDKEYTEFFKKKGLV